MCAATFALVFIGGLVTSTDSGLAVPDWPLAFGQFFPKMEGGVLFEHGHRMVAAGVGFLTIILYVWCLLGGASRAATNLAGIALVAVVVQGMLGGITVLLKLPPAVSVAHACLAQGFLCMTVAIAAMTGPGWGRMSPLAEGRSVISLRGLALATSVAVYGQLILGAVMRHTRAGLAIPDFPLAYGRIVPPLQDVAIRIHFAHRVWALVVTCLALWLALRVIRARHGEPRLMRPTMLMLTLLTVQLVLGAFTIWTRKGVLPTTTHVLVGAMILGTSFLLTLRTYRLVSPQGAGAERRAVPESAAA